MKTFWVFLSVFFILSDISVGEIQPSQSNVENSASGKVKHSLKLIEGGKSHPEWDPGKAKDSLVLVVGHDRRGHRLWEELGWIAKDDRGTVGVMASFRVIDRAFDEDISRVFVGVYTRPGSLFAVKELKKVDPIENAVFLTLNGDVTQNGRVAPLPFAETAPRETEPLFYTIRQTSVQSNSSWFEMKKVQSAIFLPSRQDFLLDTNIKAVDSKNPVNSLVMNQRGEVVSFASRGAEYILFGTSLNDLKGFVSGPSEDCSIDFLRGCIIKARKKLYKGAYSNDRAARELISHKSEDHFAEFMRSIEISDSVRVAEEREHFLKISTRWNPDLYYQWLVNAEGEKEFLRGARLNHLEESVRKLAEQGHPHFQYLLALVSEELNRPPKIVLHWLQESSGKGYAPALFRESLFHLTGSVNGLKGLTAGSHASLQQLLGFVEKDLREKVMDFIKDYEKTASLVNLPPRRRLYNFFQNIRDVWYEGFSIGLPGTGIPYAYRAPFLKALDNLIQGFDLLYKSVDQNYGPAQELVSNLEKHIISWRQLTEVSFSQHIEQCEQLFVKYMHH